MPLLSCLILDGSELQFLRDLGSHLPSLETLSVAKCGLHSLDGTFAFPNLRTLIASGNEIEIPSQAAYLRHLSHLDLSFNPLQELEKSFGPLRPCANLRSLKLIGCPVSLQKNFSSRMKRILPQVKELRPDVIFTTSTEQPDSQGNTKQSNKQKEAGELEPVEMMKLHQYIDRELNKYSDQRASLILSKELRDPAIISAKIDGSQFASTFRKNFDKFRQNLQRSKETREAIFTETDFSESYITDVAESSHEDVQSSGPYSHAGYSSTTFTGLNETTTTGIDSRKWEGTGPTTSAFTTATNDVGGTRMSDLMDGHSMLEEEQMYQTEAREDKNHRPQGTSLLEKKKKGSRSRNGKNNNTSATMEEGNYYSSGQEDFWDAREEVGQNERREDGNEEYEVAMGEVVGDDYRDALDGDGAAGGDFGIMRQNESPDDFEEGDGDYIK
jgi:hypothetical protein